MTAKKGRAGKWIGRVLLALVVLAIVGAIAIRFVGLELRPPHTVLGSAEPLGDAKRAELDAALVDDRPLDRDEAIRFALDFTAKSLSFSLDHPTSFAFGTQPRHGNCVEYSDLFAAAFDAAAKVAGSTARAYRVHSGDVRVFGKVVPLRGFADHDWVLIADKADGARIYVDPTLYDAWLGSGIERNVVGRDAIAIPR